MRKTAKSVDSNLCAEYDFSHGVAGKYTRRYARGTNVVVLEPDVAKAFPNTKAVNNSLRALANIFRQQKRTLGVK